jgi:hypothetical protein
MILITLARERTNRKPLMQTVAILAFLAADANHRHPGLKVH